MRAFTLVELLSVLAVLSLFLAFIVPGISGLLMGSSSHQTATTLSAVVAQARQRAMTQLSPVAMVLTRPSPDSDQPQALLLLEAIPSSGEAEGSPLSSYHWRPLGSWSFLPGYSQTRVKKVEASATFYATGVSAPFILPSPLPVQLNHEAVLEYDFILFNPNGTVRSPIPEPGLEISPKRGADRIEAVVVISNAVASARVLQY